MPEGKNSIVDCKVSLDNWTQFINEKEPKERDRQLTKHIDSVKDHIKKLSNKNYNKLYNLNSFQSIIMFMPFETSYISVLEKDQELLDEAFKSNILLSGPSSFMALLKIIEQLKSQQKQVDNISKVIGSAEIIFDKYVSLKESIKKAISSYNSHAGHLKKIITTAYGNQGLEKQIKKLKDEHGLLPGKQLSDISSEESTVANVDDPESEENKWN
jgi:DNA recombination protein RmuC